MIKTTLVSGPVSAPTLVIIPGGPGISSLSMRSMDILARSFQLLYVDFPGTNGNPYDKDRSFEELAAELRDVIKEIPGDVFTVGHSFGGFFAAKAGLDIPNIKGIICISVPFSKKCWRATVDNFEERKTSELKEAEKQWDAHPSDKTFADWLAAYGELYFSPETVASGHQMLRSDPCSHRAFLHNQRDIYLMEHLLDDLSGWQGLKLFLAEDRGMIPSNELKNDADRGGFIFECIKGSSHFVMFDRPEDVARLIEKNVATSRERT